MEQFGYKIAYNSLTRDFQTGIKNTLIQIWNGIHSTFLDTLLWSATEQVTGN